MSEQRFIDWQSIGAPSAPRSRARRRMAPALLAAIATAAVAAQFAVAADDPTASTARRAAPTVLNEALWIADARRGSVLSVRNDGRGRAAKLRCGSARNVCLLARNANGPAAQFVAPRDVAPFKVRFGSAKVRHLDADKLDGKGAAEIVNEALDRARGGRTPTGPAGGDLTGFYPDPTLAVGSIETAAIFANPLLDGPAGEPTLRSLGTGPGQAAAGDDPRFSDPRAPTGAAGGDLTGTYPDPAITDGAVDAAAIGADAVGAAELADDAVDSAAIDDGAIDSTSLFDSSLLDGAAGTATLRSLGTGANQAAAGDDPRLSNARAPTGPAGGDLTGTYPNPTIGANAVDSAAVANGSLRLGDLAVFTANVVLAPTNLGANSCGTSQIDLSGIFDVQAGDIAAFYPPVDGGDNALGVQWIGGSQDGDEIVRFAICNHTGATASAGGTVPVRLYRP